MSPFTFDGHLWCLICRTSNFTFLHPRAKHFKKFRTLTRVIQGHFEAILPKVIWIILVRNSENLFLMKKSQKLFFTSGWFKRRLRYPVRRCRSVRVIQQTVRRRPGLIRIKPKCAEYLHSIYPQTKSFFKLI